MMSNLFREFSNRSTTVKFLIGGMLLGWMAMLVMLVISITLIL